MDDPLKRIADLSPEKRALLAKRVRSEGGALQLIVSDPIAIVGMGCRFPGGANSPEAFWQLLRDGVDAVSEVPSDRWAVDDFYDPNPEVPGKMYTRWGGFLDRVDLFDPGFFGISPREAAAMDPQQRLFLEVAWEALERAGQQVDQLAGGKVGVFVGVSGSDYGQLQGLDSEHIDVYSGTGVAANIIAGRLSYLLDFWGPSVAVDTACSSSLVAIHLACQSLRIGECGVAIAGGVSAILSPWSTVNASKMQVMAPDGRCKTFDARANGFVRSEGCGVVVLKRLSDALADGDPILALIRGSAVNQDGRSSGLTAPNTLSQQAVLREALANAGLLPSQIGYIETHGTGTALGDPIEVESLSAVLGQPRDSGLPCVLGAVKTNIGHLEAAAGIAGLIKTVLALQHEAIPSNLHFQVLNPHINLSRTSFVIPTSLYPWPASETPRYVGISSFGWSGTNAHVILQEAPRTLNVEPALVPTLGRPYLLSLSTRSPAALQELARAYQGLLTAPDAPLADICYTASRRRTHHEYRLTATGFSSAELVEQLQAFLDGETRPGLTNDRISGEADPQLVMVFPGYGAQWTGMARQLLANEPVFRQAIEACAAAFRPHVSWSLLDILNSDTPSPHADQSAVVQPTMFAMAVGLHALWQSWGVRPAAVVGHSMGEIAAAYVAGVLTLDQAARIVCRRGEVMQRATGQGSIVMAELTIAEAEAAIAPYAGRLSIAGINSNRSILISGETSALDELQAALTQREVFCRRVKIDVASHSPQMEPLAPALRAALSGVTPQAGQVPFYSTVEGRALSGRELDVDYWVRNMCAPVRFAPAVEQLLADGYTLFLEVSPHPVLLPSITNILRDREVSGTLLPSLRRETDTQASLIGTLGALYCNGYPLEWERLYPQGRCVPLPTYPWQRERYWLESLGKVPHARPILRSGERHPLLGVHVSPADPAGSHYWELDLGPTTLSYLADHKVQDLIVLPGMAYLELALAGARDALGDGEYALEQVQFTQMLSFGPEELRTLQLQLVREGGERARFAVYSRSADTPEADWMLHASGQIRLAASAAPDPIDWSVIQGRCAELIPPTVYYEQLVAQGLHYGPLFQGVAEVWRRDGEALTRLEVPSPLRGDLANYLAHPAVLDAGLQVMGAVVPEGSRAEIYLPVGVGQVRVYHPVRGDLWSYGQMDLACVDAAVRTLDVWLLDRDGQVVVALEGVRLQRLAPQQRDPVADWLHTIRWAPQPAADPELSASGGWLILGDTGGVGVALAQALSARGASWVQLVMPSGAAGNMPDVAEIDPMRPEHFRQLLAQVSDNRSAPCGHVVYLWGLDGVDGDEPSTEALAAAQMTSCGGLTHLVQALTQARWRDAPRLWVVTRGTQAVEGPASVAGVSGSPLWGLMRTIAYEHPEVCGSLVDLAPSDHADEVSALAATLVAGTDEDQVALRAGGSYVARLSQATLAADELATAALVPAGEQPFRLTTLRPGVLDHLTLRAIARRTPGPGEVEVQVEASGLNFIDVLIALGLIPDDNPDGPSIGLECAGRIVAVGDGVEGLQVGQPVVAITKNGFSTHVTVPAYYAVPLPEQLSLTAASSIPIAFLTVYYSLHYVARLQPGERILIHSAAGGVGQAAVQMAQQIGAEIYATAGSPEKRALLHSMGVRHVFDSRSLSFVEEVRAATNGEGVDVVINSLAGEFIPASFDLLRDYGRFIELGKRDYYEDRKLGLRPFLKNLSFSLVDVRNMLVQRPQLVSRLFRELMDLFARGELRPTPYQEVPITRVLDAFHTMAQGKHTGKLVVTFSDRARARIVPTAGAARVRPDATYLITGGLGGIGLRLAAWLVDQGARHLALVGRRGPTPEAQAVLEELASQGAQVQVLAADIADPAGVRQLLDTLAHTQPPLRGVFHGAAVLDDGVLQHLTSSRLARVLAPKVAGAWNLHTQTQGLELDHFVLFSSVAAVLGSPGQANYAAANTFLDTLAHYRRAQGLPGLSVNWGPWADVGLAAQQANRGERLSYRGMGSIPPAQGLEVLGRLMKQGVTQISVVPLNLRQWRQYYPKAGQLPVLRELSAAMPSSPSGGGTLRATLAAAEEHQRWGLLEGHLREQIAQVLRLEPGRVKADVAFSSLGFDSLMAVELRNRLEASLGLTLPTTLVWVYPTLNALVPHLAGKLGLVLDTSQENDQEPQMADELTANLAALASLSDDEVEALLLAKLETVEKRGLQ